MVDALFPNQFVLYGDNGYDSHVISYLLEEKRLSYQFHAVHDTRPDELAELNPYRTLPILVNKEVSLYETNIIFEYLEERHPAVKLLPTTPKDRALARTLAWRIQRDWLSLARELMTHPDSFDPSRADIAKKSLTDTLLTLAPIFVRQPFFLADALGWCDILLMPLLHRLDDMGIQLPPKHARAIHDYYARLKVRAAFIASLKAINTPVDWD